MLVCCRLSRYGHARIRKQTVCLPSCLSVCQAICLSISMSVWLSVCQTIYVAVCPSGCLYISGIDIGGIASQFVMQLCPGATQLFYDLPELRSTFCGGSVVDLLACTKRTIN